MTASKIQWTDETWNPTTGCDQVSSGCDNCYALTMAARLKAMGQAKYQTDGRPETSGPGFGLQVHPDTLDQPMRWRKPRRVFVNSMSDLFHPQVPDDFIADVFAVMAATPQHTYQILTKRPKRMRSLLTYDYLGDTFEGDVRNAASRTLRVLYDNRMADPNQAERLARVDRNRGVEWERRAWPGWSLPNVWLGTSVEDQDTADQRVPQLLATPAAVRFLSCEPLLGPVDLIPSLKAWAQGAAVQINANLHWLIVGGESGKCARPMHLGWARSLVEQCRQAEIPAFVKQLGSMPVYGVPARAEHRYRVTGKGGEPTEWPLDLRVREFPEAVR